MIVVQLSLVDAMGALHPPFMTVNLQEPLLVGFLKAIEGLLPYVPIRAIVNGHVATNLLYTAESIRLQGQPVRFGGGT